ncbi:hypothetical protein J5N97_012463 [Dioscorea zingiberensis]|uniref:Uncharacterized protein n=1 Tax=Dioscorea zingiberensis TaxID=325984 RepID=A0A9D5CQ71_9LILI|nr:hypothetical protein J5N97_012463 [Dioscorea zingiberensis]
MTTSRRVDRVDIRPTKKKEKTQLPIAANDMEKSIHIDSIGQDQHGPIATGIESEQVDNVESGPTKRKKMSQGHVVVAAKSKGKSYHIEPITHGPTATESETIQLDKAQAAVAGKNKQVHNIGVQTRRSKILLEASGMNVLDANPVHVKALYRRGMAYMLGGRACYCCEGDYGPQEYDCNKARSPKTISGITIFDTKEKKTYDSVPDLEIFVDPI